MVTTAVTAVAGAVPLALKGKAATVATTPSPTFTRRQLLTACATAATIGTPAAAAATPRFTEIPGSGGVKALDLREGSGEVPADGDQGGRVARRRRRRRHGAARPPRPRRRHAGAPRVVQGGGAGRGAACAAAAWGDGVARRRRHVGLPPRLQVRPARRLHRCLRPTVRGPRIGAPPAKEKITSGGEKAPIWPAERSRTTEQRRTRSETSERKRAARSPIASTSARLETRAREGRRKGGTAPGRKKTRSGMLGKQWQVDNFVPMA
ncbi:hypothetical protein BAE44_0025968 [Dichanthelium oligosanthes]|uniref:Uncharacterized protein n=1 Tax=Dichanthelium oligosanthes TaxID=888268 RepID=A0A1E5UJF7_9POAL|nr:hypothetical protein BAE44_0025968 [Dichanthelium oligosanthes]